MRVPLTKEQFQKLAKGEFILINGICYSPTVNMRKKIKKILSNKTYDRYYIPVLYMGSVNTINMVDTRQYKRISKRWFKK